MNIDKKLVALVLSVVLVQGAELPVRTVVLYKHGVGYFERAGTLGPGESGRLDFNAAEMNDVLKSLTITDNGGKVTGIRYDSNIPLQQKLSEFPFSLQPGEPLSRVLDQVKGARVEMEFGNQKVAGAIVAARLIPGDKDRPEREQLTLLLDSGELRNVDLSAASALRFSDPKLQLQFRDYLGALTAERSKDKRTVYIDSTDTKSRQVTANYIMPMPAWKSSYRLLFDATGLQPVIEGWAIVDNTTGDDWTNVHISLISGKPISFMSELYNPKYIHREGAELPEDQAVAPVLYKGAMNALPAPAVAENSKRQEVIAGNVGGVPGAVRGGRFMTAEPAMPSDRMASTPSSLAIEGSGTEVADLFEYSVKDAVTVKKNESAMLPFLQQKITARKLIVYSDQSRPNPLNAAELTNTAGRTLDGGPVTVYDAGTYAGEALTETIKSGDKRLISYGVDLGTRISTATSPLTSDVREIHARNGSLVTKYSRVQKRIYSIRNVDARAKTLIIEHPITGGFTLIDTPKPVETTSKANRFEIKLAANASIDFPVTEENIYDQQTSVTSMTPDALLVWLRNKALSDTAKRQLQAISDVKTQLAANDTEKRRIDGDVANITRDEERNRQNISSLSAVSGQQQVVQDYARKLADQEVQIAKLRERQGALETQHATLQNQLNGLIEKLEF
ncbi:MAG: hypothetical protein JWN34_2879 [Bryobacterales bacterium]|nr:hypothetical protein [Bryobacterales bacterium]